MKSYILAMVVLFSLAAPAMAAELNATQISYTEMWVNGTEFTPDATVTLSTSTIVPAKLSGQDKYSYKITGMCLPAGSVLKLDASPVNDDLKLYVKIKWLLKMTFENGSDGISYNYNDATDTVNVGCRIPSWPIAFTFQTIEVYGTTNDASVNLSVTVQREVAADGSGSFSEKVDIGAIPAGNYTIIATDDGTPSINATNQTDIYTPKQLHHIKITYPQTSELTLNTTENHTFGATGYDFRGKVVQNTVFTWTSISTYVGTIDYSTGYFEAENAGNTKVYARSGTKKSGPVTVYVNAQTVEEDVIDGSGSATSGGSIVDVSLNDTSVGGTVNIQEIGDPTNNTDDANLGLSSGNQLVKGAFVNASSPILDALSKDTNGTSWVQIRMEYNQSVINSLNIKESTLNIWKYNETTDDWELVKNQPYCLESGRDMDANYLWVNVTHLCPLAIVGATIPSSSGGGGGGGGTYPPGYGTPTPKHTATIAPTTPQGVPQSPAGGKLTPSPAKAKPAAAGATTTAPGEEAPTKKDIPGFTAVFAIAGVLAIAYMVMRRSR